MFRTTIYENTSGGLFLRVQQALKEDATENMKVINTLSWSCSVQIITIKFFYVYNRWKHRSSHQKVFTRKHLCQSLRSATLLKNNLYHRCFHVNFAKFLRAPFLTENLWWLLLEIASLNYLTALFLSCHGLINNENVQRAVFCLCNGKVHVDTKIFTILNKCSKLSITSMLTSRLHLFHHSSVLM